MKHLSVKVSITIWYLLLMTLMAGLVLGYDPWALGIQMHQVDVEPLLDKMGIEYDPAAKYLGRNGKYIGKPASAVVNCCPTDTIYDIRE